VPATGGADAGRSPTGHWRPQPVLDPEELAIGAKDIAAELGIPVKMVPFWLYVASGLASALGGLIVFAVGVSRQGRRRAEFAAQQFSCAVAGEMQSWKRFPTLEGNGMLRFVMSLAVAGLMGGSAYAQEQLVVGIGTDPSLAPFIVAVEKGFFTERGIDAVLAPYQNGALSVQAVLSGQADIGASGESTAIAPAAQGAPLHVLGTVYVSGKQTGLAVRPGVDTPADLANGKIGTVQNSVAEYFWQLYADHWKIEGAEVVPLAQPDIAAAFARGDIDGYTVFEPTLTRSLEGLPGSKVLARSGDDDIYVLTAYILAGKRVAEDLELAKATVEAVNAAVDFIAANPEESVQIVSDWIQLDPQATASIMGNIDFGVRWSPNETLHLQQIAQWMVDRKLIETLPAWDSFIATDALAAALPAAFEGR